MKLFYSPGACSLADHIALSESGLPYDLEKVDLKAKRTENGADYSAINPKGYVPALQLDGGEVLTENIAILGYVGSKAPALLPSDGLPHWRVLEMASFISTELHKSFKPFFSPAATEAERAAARETLGKRFAFLVDALGSRSFIVGDTMSIADCYLFVMLSWAMAGAKLDVPAPLKSYHERLKQRPAVAKALGEEGLS